MHQHEWMEDLILSPGLPHRPASSAAPCEEVKCCVYDLWGSLPLLPFLPSSNHSTIVVLACTVTLPLTSPSLGACCFLSLEFLPLFFLSFFLANVTFLFSPFSISVPVLLYCYTGTGVLYRSQCSSRVSSQKPSRLPIHLAAPSAI